MHLMIENENDETFKNQFIQALIDNRITIQDEREPVLFSDKYPLIYNYAKQTYLVLSDQTDEEKTQADIVQTDYNKTKLGRFYQLHNDYHIIDLFLILC